MSVPTKIKLIRFALILFGLTSVYFALHEGAWLGGRSRLDDDDGKPRCPNGISIPCMSATY